jgi:hypothetical protein
LDEVTITADEFAAMLRCSGAPESWADPCAAQKLAEEITFRWPDERVSPPSTFRRAQDAIDMLREVLPEIVKSLERLLDAMNRPPPGPMIVDHGAEKRLLANLEAFLGLQQALPERRLLEVPRRGRSTQPAWHTDAIRLFALYQNLVDPRSGISADGPGVRFIKAVLLRMDHRKTLEPLAIAKALQRHRTRFLKGSFY